MARRLLYTGLGPYSGICKGWGYPAIYGGSSACTESRREGESGNPSLWKSRWCLPAVDDDGETFDYENGAYSWRDIIVTRDKKGKLKGVISKAEKGKPNSIANVTWKFMTEE